MSKYLFKITGIVAAIVFLALGGNFLYGKYIHSDDLLAKLKDLALKDSLSLDRERVLGASLDYEVFSGILTSDGNYSLLQIINGKISGNGFESEITAKMPDGELISGNYTNSIPEFTLANGKKSPASIIERAITVLKLNDGKYLALKITKGEVKSGRLSGIVEARTVDSGNALYLATSGHKISEGYVTPTSTYISPSTRLVAFIVLKETEGLHQSLISAGKSNVLAAEAGPPQAVSIYNFDNNTLYSDPDTGTYHVLGGAGPTGIPSNPAVANQINQAIFQNRAVSTPSLVSPQLAYLLLGPASITNAMIQDGAVTGAKIALGSITAGDIATGTITSDKLASGVLSTTISDGSISTSKLADSAVTSAKIAGNTIGTDKLSGTLTFGGSILVDLSQVTHSSTAQQGLILPNVSSSAPSNPASGKGYLAYDTADKQVLFYNGSAWGTVGSGTITSVNSGNGLSGGGSSGAVTLSVNTTDISACTSTSSQKIIWDSVNNRFTCGTDQTIGGSASSLSSITAALSSNTIASGDLAQIWNWSLTTAGKTAFKFGESAASTATGNPYILGVSTLTGSTASPLLITAGGTSNGVKVDTTGLLSAIGTGGIQATTLGGATFAAPGAIGATTPGTGAFTTLSATGAINGATISGGTLSGGTHSGTAISGTGPFTITGGTGVNDTLTLISSSNLTKGDIQFFSPSNKITSAGALTVAGALSASNFSGISSGTNTGDQTITLTGDVAGTGTGSFAATIGSGAVTFGKMANLAANSIIGNNTGISASPLALTASQVKTLLSIATGDVSGLGTIATQSASNVFITGGALSGLTSVTASTFTGALSGNSSNITGVLGATSFPAMTGDVTNTQGSLATAISSGAVSLSKMANLAANSIIGNNTGISAAPVALTAAQVKSLLAITNTDVSGLGTLSTQNSNAITVTGGSINGTTVGATTPSTGAFTALSGTTLSTTSYATISGSLALGNTNAAAGPGHLNISGNLTTGGPISAPTTTNTINGLIINAGALSGISTINASGQITSTLATGTAPFAVSSTTNVANLNASSLNGATFAAPGAIGGVTPGTGAFTTLSATGAITGATATNTINGLIINAGALSGISTIATSGTVNGATISGGNISGGTLSGTALTGTGAFTVNTTGNANGLNLNTATGASGNSGAITIQTGGTSVSGASGNIVIDVGAGATSNGTIGIGTANSGTITIGRSTQGITLPGFTGNNAVLYGTTSTGVLAAATTSTSGLCLVSGAATGYVPTWTTCPGGGGGNWGQLTSPGADLSLAMGANHTTFTWGGNTATTDMFKITDNATNTGTGYILDVAQVAGSAAKPLKVTQGANTLIDTTSAGALTLTSASAATWGTGTGNLNIQVAGAATSANVQIGAGGGGSTTPDFLVLDQDTAALPASTNGAMALDSTGKFNVFEGGAWKVLCNKTDAACGAGSGSALSAITAAIAGNTINSGDNAQVWNWSLATANKTALSFGENIASTATGAPYILGISTLNTSTANPLIITAQGSANGVKVDTTGLLQAVGTGGIKATTLGGATFAAPGAIGSTTPGTGAFITLSATGAITGATATNTINGLVINAGALSGITTVNASGQITSTLATGTAPFAVSSTTNVANLNASSLNGATFAAPGAIGGGTPSTGAFTALSGTTLSTTSYATISGSLALGNTNAAAGPGHLNISGNLTTGGPISAPTTTNTINGLIINAGAISGASTLGLSGAITGATATNTINGLIINSGALSGITTVNASGQITSTLANGTAPLVVASSTNVANLNASSLNGATFTAPGAIGGGTPGTAAFTTISASGLVSANGGLTLAAGQNLAFTSGTGTLTQNYSNTTGTQTSLNHTNSGSSGANTSTVLGLAITGTANAAGSNTITGVNFPNITAATNNTFYGLVFGTGLTDILRYNGAQIISGTGIVQSAGVSGSYTGITGTGALAAGSIASGFGTISTGNTITGTTLNGTTGINTGAGAGTQRIDASGNLANIGNVTGTGAVTVNTTGNLNGLTLNTAAGSSGNSGAITIQTGGTVTSGASGNITIDVGAGATSNGTISIGATNASALTIGKSAVTTTVNGTLAVAGLSVTGGTINNTSIGATTANTGKFTTLTSTGATDLANAGASNVTIATTGTGTVAIGNSTGTLALTGSNATLSTGGVLTIGKASTTTGQMVFTNSLAAGTTAFQAGNQGVTNVTYTLPTADAAVAGYVLSSNGTGTLSWVANGSGAGCSSCVQLVPTSTGANTVQPTAAGVIGLTIKGSSTSNAKVLDIFDSAVTPAEQAFFDSTGAFTVNKAITAPTVTNTINGLVINAGALSGITTVNASGQITSTLATGTAPFAVSSTTNVANLNASSLNGATFAAPGAIGGGTPGTGAFTTLSATGAITGATATNTINGLVINSGALSGISTINASGQITSTLANGTAPLVVASSTNVANLNASSLNGATFAAPGAIGGTTPGAGTFTSLSGTTLSTTSYATMSASLALGNTNAAAGPGHLNISGNLTTGGPISAPTATNTINGLIINTGAVSGVSTLGLSGAITGATATNTINGLVVNSGALSSVTTLGLSGAITGATVTNTINGIVINAGAVSGVSTLGLSGAITGATATNTINGMVINAGAVSGVTTLGASSTVTIGSGGNTYTFNPAAAPALAGTARPDRREELMPEYPGAVLTGTGVGTMTSDFCAAATGAGGLPATLTTVCNTAGDTHNYYNWTTSQGTAQTYSIWIKWRVPDNFSAWDATNSIQAFAKRSDATNGHVNIKVYDTANALNNAGGTEVAGAANTWVQNGINITTGTWTPGGYATIEIDMTAAATGGTVNVGEINLNFLTNN